ncbi:Unknown protein sequence [Pseudomonas amygdali pv. sesami]|nr:Unknown protein sequence [Pseudomonas amygdali pv. sesami]
MKLHVSWHLIHDLGHHFFQSSPLALNVHHRRIAWERDCRDKLVPGQVCYPLNGFRIRQREDLLGCTVEAWHNRCHGDGFALAIQSSALLIGDRIFCTGEAFKVALR